MPEPDHVTGLESRAALESFFARLPTESSPVALVMCDVVGLKEVNEREGFSTGDTRLQHAALRLRSAAADADILARLGGDELIAVFSGPHAAASAERAAAHLSERSMPRLRVATIVQTPGETRVAAIDRLYAIVRRS